MLYGSYEILAVLVFPCCYLTPFYYCESNISVYTQGVSVKVCVCVGGGGGG